jgi:hypothetical protein
VSRPPRRKNEPAVHANNRFAIAFPKRRESGPGEVEGPILLNNEGKGFAEQQSSASMARNGGTGEGFDRDKTVERV